jgi:hypothetical protein
LLDRLRRADGALEIAVEAEAMERRKRETSDERYNELLLEQNRLLRERARLTKGLPEGVVWQDIKDGVMAGDASWSFSDIDYGEAQKIVLGLSRTTRKLERQLRQERKDEAHNNDGPVKSVADARKAKLAVLKEIRRNELMRVIWPKAKALLRKDIKVTARPRV